MGRFSRLGNDLYEGRTSIDFIGRKWLWYAVSGLIIALAAGGLFIKGLNLGIEFEGGVETTVSLPASGINQNTADEVGKTVSDTGVEGAASPIVSTGDKSIRVQTDELTPAETEKVVTALADRFGLDADKDISTTEVGASWGSQVAKRALTGLIVFLVLVVLFIWAYFREWKMSVAALVALAHDLIITVGIYALSGFEVTPATVTGVLTILGFSLYDTVVVFDKVRENTKDLRKGRRTYAELANLAVNQTLVRSINTSVVALLPVGAILYVGAFMLGAGSLKDLALALFVGMAAGAYSSLFIATPLAVHLKQGEKDITEADRRARSRAKRDVDPYAQVPVFTDDMAVDASPDFPVDPEAPDGPDGEQPARTPFRAPTGRAEASGSGRVVPPAKSPLRDSGAAKRSQPSRQPRSKRGK